MCSEANDLLGNLMHLVGCIDGLVLQMALKCADLGHLAAPCDVHKRWVNDLTEEFFQQGDRERENGMKVSALMDRHNQAAGGISKSQVATLQLLPAHTSLCL